MLRSDPSTSSASTGSGPGSNPSHTAHAADSPGSVPVPAHAPPGPSPPPAPQAPSSSKPQTRLNKFLLPFTEVFHLGSSSSSSQSHHNSNSSSSSPRETSSATSPTSAAKHSGQHNQHQQHREPVAVSDQPAQHQLHQQPQQQQPQPKLRRAPSLVSRISRSSQLGQSFRSLFSSNKSSSASSARLKNSASTQCLSSTVNPALVQPTASPLGAAAPASSPLAPIDESTTHLPPATPTLAPRPLNKRWSAADLRAAAAAAPEDVDGLAHVIAPMVAAESSSTDHLPEGGHDALVMQQPAADHGTVIGPPAPPLGPGASRGSRRSLASRPSVMDLFSAMTAETPASGGQGQQQQQDYASAGAVVDLSRPIPVNVQQPIQADAQESSDSLGDALPLDMGGIGSGAVASGSESVGGSAGAEDKFFDAQSHLSTTDAGDQTRPQTPAVVVASTPPPGMKPISTKPQRPTLVPLVISRANSPLSSGPALMSPTHVAFLRSNASHLASYQHSVPSNIGTSTESSERAYADRHEYHQQLYEINQQMAHVGHVPPASPSTPGPNGAGSVHLHRVGSVGPSSGSQYRHSMGGHPHASSAGGGLAVPSPTGSPVPWHHHQNAASGMTPLGTGIPGLPTSQGAGGVGNRGGPAHAVNAYATATRSMSSAAIGSGGSGMTSSASAQHLAHIVKPQPLYPNKSLLPAKPVVVAPTPVVPGQGPQQQQQQPTAAPAPEKPQAKSVAQSMLERYKLLPEFESKYVVGDELGSGGFGFVVTAIRIQDQVEVAVKFIFKDKVPVHSLVKDPVLGVIPMEVYILKNMRHPNIIGFHDFFTDKRFYYLVMELHGVPWKKNTDPTAVRSQSAQPPQAHRSASESTVAGRPPVLGKRHSMDLFECIEANSRLSEDIARKIFGQVVSAVHYLDSYRIVHRDIKDENIVVDQHFIVKIIDFGSALMVPSNGRLFDRFAGTLQYCPPEVLQGHKYRGPEQEVWALGILLYTILFSGAPFANVSQVLNAEVPIPKYSRGPSAGKPRASEEVIHLLRWMLRKSPSDRASIEQVLTHPWLAKRPPAPPMAAPAAGETGAEAVVDAQRRASQSSQQPLEPPHNPRLHSSPEQYGTGIVRGKSPVPTAVPSMDHHHHHHHHHHHQPQQQQLLRRATPSGNLQEMFKAGLVSTSSPQQPQQPSSSLSVTSSSSDIVPSFTTTSPSPAPAAQYLSAALISVPAKRHPLQQEVLPDSPSPSPAPSPLVGRPKDPLAQVQQNGSAASAAI